MRMRRALPVLLLAGLALALYLPTWSPVGTWAHFGDDGPELEAAGRTLGIPHPTGYPLLMLLVRMVGLVVPPPIAALNIVTLLASVAAVVAAGHAGRSLAARALRRGNEGPHLTWIVSTAGLLAGAFLALSFTWWRQAVIGEVYTLHVALFAGALSLILAGGPRHGMAAAYLLGLGMAHHLQTFPLLMVLLSYLALCGRLRPRLRSWLVAGALFALPLSLYLVLVIRSRLEPPFDWGNPETIRGLWWSLSGTAYRQNLFREGIVPFLHRWGDALARDPGFQLGAGGAALAVLGFVVAVRRAPREALLLVLLFLVATFVAAAYAIPDPAAYMLPGVLALALASGLGGAWLLERAVATRRALAQAPWRLAPAAAAFAFVAASLGSRIAIVGREANASRDQTGYQYARDGIESLSSRALVVSHGDGRTFSLWYGAEVLSPRHDVAILYDNLLEWPWYRAFVARKHPDITLPPDGLPRSLRRGALIERHLDERPVYVTELEPELASLFAVEPSGPLFRIVRRSNRH